jgi:DNA-directed RNA polymerase specialized sigma24 family protein
MTGERSVTHWLYQLQGGDSQAAAKLWERYFHRLVGLARAALREAPRRAADEEDVALSAFDSFCRGAEAGRFPDLSDRDSLWHLLVVLTARKAAHLRRDQRRQKRGGGAVLDEAALAGTGREGHVPLDLDQIVGDEPTPDLAAQVAEELERLLHCLGEPELKSIAVWKMEGHTNQEVATRLDCCQSTVERRLQVIRRLWAEEAPHDP